MRNRIRKNLIMIMMMALMSGLVACGSKKPAKDVVDNNLQQEGTSNEDNTTNNIDVEDMDSENTDTNDTSSNDTESKEDVENTTSGKENETTSGTSAEQDNHKHIYITIVTSEATCVKKGLNTHSCACGHKYTEDIAKKAHSYGQYTYNKDATTEKDGTKTAVCTACGYKNTITASGTKLSYTYKHLNKTMYVVGNTAAYKAPTYDSVKGIDTSINQKVTVTGQCNENGWYQIKVNGATYYVENKYLGDTWVKQPIDQPAWLQSGIGSQIYTEEDIEREESDTVIGAIEHARVGLHKYTSDGKYQLYKLDNWEFPDGSKHMGMFVCLDDVEYQEDGSVIKRYREVNYAGGEYLVIGYYSRLDTHFEFIPEGYAFYSNYDYYYYGEADDESKYIYVYDWDDMYIMEAYDWFEYLLTRNMFYNNATYAEALEKTLKSQGYTKEEYIAMQAVAKKYGYIDVLDEMRKKWIELWESEE